MDLERLQHRLELASIEEFWQPVKHESNDGEFYVAAVRELLREPISEPAKAELRGFIDRMWGQCHDPQTGEWRAAPSPQPESEKTIVQPMEPPLSETEEELPPP